MSVPPEVSPRVTSVRYAELQAAAGALGLVLTIRCRYCRAPLWDSTSVVAHAGPVCRRRHENDPGAHPAKNARTEAAEINPNHHEGDSVDH